MLTLDEIKVLNEDLTFVPYKKHIKISQLHTEITFHVYFSMSITTSLPCLVSTVTTHFCQPKTGVPSGGNSATHRQQPHTVANLKSSIGTGVGYSCPVACTASRSPTDDEYATRRAWWWQQRQRPLKHRRRRRQRQQHVIHGGS